MTLRYADHDGRFCLAGVRKPAAAVLRFVLRISDSHAGGGFRSSLVERKWSATAGAFLSSR